MSTQFTLSDSVNARSEALRRIAAKRIIAVALFVTVLSFVFTAGAHLVTADLWEKVKFDLTALTRSVAQAETAVVTPGNLVFFFGALYVLGLVENLRKFGVLLALAEQPYLSPEEGHYASELRKPTPLLKWTRRVPFSVLVFLMLTLVCEAWFLEEGKLTNFVVPILTYAVGYLTYLIAERSSWVSGLFTPKINRDIAVGFPTLIAPCCRAYDCLIMFDGRQNLDEKLKLLAYHCEVKAGTQSTDTAATYQIPNII